MRTTKKEFKEKVRQHIIDRLGYPWDEEKGEENENATTKECLKNVVDEFNAWYCPYYKKTIPNKQAAFASFLNGLPGCLTIEFTTYNQRETLRAWFEQTEEESEKYNDEKVNNLYMWLIYREFFALCKKYGVNF